MDLFDNPEQRIVCRVLMRGDGSVHICFPNVRSIEATPVALSELFSNPFDFILSGSFAYKDSSLQINRNRVGLEEIVGLTLARVYKEKTISIEFPELFGALLAAREDDSLKNKPINLRHFEFQEEFADEKSYMVRYFLEAANHFKVTPSIKRNIQLQPEAQFPIMREIINALFDEDLPKADATLSVNEYVDRAENDLLLQTLPSSLTGRRLTLTQYAQLTNKSSATIQKYIKAGRIKSARKNENGHWEIDADDVPVEWDLNKGRKRALKVEGKHYKRPNNGTAAEVQEHARKMCFFTEDVIPYLITFQEMQYYVDHTYHEVKINGRACLIVDVNPDYISSKTGKSNRELMQAGKPPVIPQREKEEFVFNVHHMGQRVSSPYALIPSYDHNGKGMKSYFHPVKPKEDLHTPEFYAQCEQLWITLLQMYDTFHSYKKIPYLNHNPRRTKKR